MLIFIKYIILLIIITIISQIQKLKIFFTQRIALKYLKIYHTKQYYKNINLKYIIYLN